MLLNLCFTHGYMEERIYWKCIEIMLSKVMFVTVNCELSDTLALCMLKT